MPNGVEKALTAQTRPSQEQRSQDAGDPSTPEATIRAPDAPSSIPADFIPREAGAALKPPPAASSRSEADSSANHQASKNLDGVPRACTRPNLPETWYRRLVENQPDLICGFLPDTTLTYVNAAYARFFGALPEELIGRRFIDFLAVEDRAGVLEQLANMVPESPEYQYEHETCSVDGEPRWHLWHDFALFDDAGRPREFQSIGVDVTEWRRVEQALRESEYFLRKSQEMAGLGSYRFDPRADRWVSSSQLDRIFGIGDDYPRDVAGWLALIHPEQRGAMACYLPDTVLTARERFSREYGILRATDGAERWVLGRGELELDADGLPGGSYRDQSLGELPERRNPAGAYRRADRCIRHRPGTRLLRDHRDRRHPEPGPRARSDDRSEGARLSAGAGRFRQWTVVLSLLSLWPARPLGCPSWAIGWRNNSVTPTSNGREDGATTWLIPRRAIPVKPRPVFVPCSPVFAGGEGRTCIPTRPLTPQTRLRGVMARS
jgi:PAS domain S-box-containing protein